jgi:hypothetical protein
VFVFRRVHVVAELVGGEPELGFETEMGGGVFGFCGFGSCHQQLFPLTENGRLRSGVKIGTEAAEYSDNC